MNSLVKLVFVLIVGPYPVFVFSQTLLDGRDLCAAVRYAWEMDKNSEKLSVELAKCETEAKVTINAANKLVAEEALARAAREKLPSPRIGMSQRQVLNGTRWGAPKSVNKTTTAEGTTEQWVYGAGMYLYFKNGVLAAVQTPY